MEQTKQNKMGTKPVLPLIFSMSVPAMLSMMVLALYNVVDSYFVAKISESALTSVSLVFPVQNLISATAVGTGVGLNSLISRKLGEKRHTEAGAIASHGFLLGVLSWAVTALIGLFCSRLFLSAFTANQKVVDMGTDYMSIICIFSFGMFLSVNAEKTLQATGDMIHPMFSQLIGAITNIILDPCFIFGLGPFPRLEVAGAAVATVLGQIFAMFYICTVLLTKKHAIDVKLSGFRPHGAVIKNIYSVGLPAIFMQSIGSVMTVGMNAILITFSETAVAFFGVYFKLQSFVFMPVFGLNQGLLPIIGYNYGARNRKRMMQAVRYGTCIAGCVMAAGMAVFCAFPNQLLGLFNASDEMLALGVPALRTVSLCFVPAAAGIVFSACFQALGHGFASLFISILRQLAVLLPVAFLLAQITKSVPAIWYAFPIAEVVSLAASVFIFLALYRSVISLLPEHTGE